MHLKGQLHIHTTCSDGKLTPQEAAEVYERMGFDFIAITDHDHLLKPHYRDLVSEIESNLIVFYGIELTVSTHLGYVHVGRIEGEHEVLHIFNHPGDYGFSIRQTKECIEEVARLYPIDAVEVTDHGFATPEYDTSEIAYPKLATDDAHTRIGCGRAWVELDCAREKDAILRSIKRGEARKGFAKGAGSKAVVFA